VLLRELPRDLREIVIEIQRGPHVPILSHHASTIVMRDAKGPILTTDQRRTSTAANESTSAAARTAGVRPRRFV
jgi:hypothetical protein